MKDERERQQLAEELVSTEKSYLKGLKSLVKGVIKRLDAYEALGKPLVPKDQTGAMFVNIADIYDLNNRLYQDLKKLSHNGRLLTSDLPKALLLYTPFFKMYTSYVNRHDEALKAIKVNKTKPDFAFFVSHCEAVEGGQLENFMIMPVQRIPRYLLLLKGIIKLTGEDKEEFPGLNKALEQVSKVAAEINDSFAKREARARVVEVHNHVEGVPDLVTPTRWHIKDGLLSKKFNKKGLHLNSFKKYWFFLFNDMLMYTTVPNKSGNCKLKYRMPLLDTTTVDLPDEKDQKNLFQIQSASVKSFVVAAGTPQEKQDWMRVLNENIGNTLSNAATLKKSASRDSGSASSSSRRMKSSGTPSLAADLKRDIEAGRHSSAGPPPGQPPITMGNMAPARPAHAVLSPSGTLSALPWHPCFL